MTAPGATARDLCLRPPRRADGVALCALVRATPALDANSDYAYLLACTHFRRTSVVAEAGPGALCGFVFGYRRPDAPEVLFVWQVATCATVRRQGVAGRMLDHLISCQQPLGARYLEATVTPGNRPSRALFEGLARRWDAPLATAPFLAASDFPDPQHEAEVLLRIGPLKERR